MSIKEIIFWQDAQSDYFFLLDFGRELGIPDYELVDRQRKHHRASQKAMALKGITDADQIYS